MLWKRSFYTVSRGKMVGFIEDTYKHGLFFSPEFIAFRKTSSNLSPGRSYEFSIMKMPHVINLKPKRDYIEYLLSNKIPVSIEYSHDVFGAPWKGCTGLGNHALYVHSITALDEERIKVVPPTNQTHNNYNYDNMTVVAK